MYYWKNLGCVQGVLLLFHFQFFIKKYGACSGRVPGVFRVCCFSFNSLIELGCVPGVFRACSGRVLGLVARQVENSKRITEMALIGIFIFQKMWGVFWAWSGCVGFASFLKKKSGACSGRVVFALIFKKKSGACSGRVPGVLFLLYFFEKNWGVFWACSVCSSVFSVLFLLTLWYFK